MAESRPEFFRRTPDAARLKWARDMLEKMDGQRPRNRPEVYAEQAVWIHENPVEEVPLQAIRIGGLGITAIPCEVYALTGLKLKSASPLPLTFNISLANGASGYIPPPEQHALGGYTTWPARTAGLEVNAEPRIVEETTRLLEQASGRARKKHVEPMSPYATAVMASKPTAFWRLGEQAGPTAAAATGKGNDAEYKPGVAFHLPGYSQPSAADYVSRAAHFAGGCVVAEVPAAEAFTVEFWLWNGAIKSQHGRDSFVAEVAGLNLRIVGVTNVEEPVLTIVPGRVGRAAVPPRKWHHVAVVGRPGNYQLWVNGVKHLDEKWEPNRIESSPKMKLTFGGSDDGLIEFAGKLDEIAFFNRALTPGEIKKHNAEN